MYLTQEVSVGGAFPLPRPLILLQQPPEEPLSLVPLLGDVQLDHVRPLVTSSQHGPSCLPSCNVVSETEVA